MTSPTLKNYKKRFPFKLATTSYIYPDKIVPNVAKLAPSFDEIELVFFESESQDNLLKEEEMKALTDLSSHHGLTYDIHLPLDVLLGDKNEAIRRKGISVVKELIARTLALNPSVYTLHLNTFDGAKPRFLDRGKKRRSVSTLSARRTLDQPVEGVDFEDSIPDVRDVEGWRLRLIQSLEEILNDGIESSRISIETLNYPFEWVEDIIKKFELSVCLDIGHLLIHGRDLKSYLKKYLSNASIVHLHGFQNGTDHLGIDRLPDSALGSVLPHLCEYQGIVSLEVFSIDDLEKSLITLEEKWEKR